MTYGRNGRTLNGTDPVAALITLQSLGAVRRRLQLLYRAGGDGWG